MDNLETQQKNVHDQVIELLKSNDIPFTYSDLFSKNGKPKSIFISFDKEGKKEQDSIGLYIHMHEMQGADKPFPCMVLSSTIKAPNEKKLKEVSEFLNHINLISPVGAWVTDAQNSLLHFKYLYPCHTKAEINQSFLLLVFEIFNRAASALPIILEIDQNKMNFAKAKESFEKAFA